MKKIIFLLLTNFFSLTTVHAQTHVRDSLKLLLQKEKTDTSRVLLLSDLAFEYVGSKPDTMMVLALEGLSLSSRIGFLKGEAVSLNRIGGAFSNLGNYPQAMESLLQALKINEKMKNLDGMGRNLNQIGGIYYAQGDYRLALDYYVKATALAEKMNNKILLSIYLNGVGRTYMNLKKIDSARLFVQQAYNVAYEVHNSRIIGSSLTYLGDIHSATRQDRLALEYYRLSIPYSEKAENYAGLSGTFLGMAKLFEKSGQNDSSLIYAKRAFLFVKEKGFTKAILDASSFLSTFYRNRRNMDSLLFYQDISKSAYDSLFSQQKTMQLQSIGFDEKLRQMEIAEDRKNNLQFAAMAIGLITFIILFFALSRSIIVKTKFIEFFGILGLLAVFEFINLFIHPYLAHLTNDSPVLMLGVLIAIGALLIPFHHKLEKWITKIMVEKNKKIRLEAAKKTIAILEPAFVETTAGKTEQSD
ncbi:tetratricopeptide repeat protein [Daejeonella sp.]|uniref:tetratricopeptide repeat protein n=1 Tax=Daejeonella sp. TaxID=2805397 RepID=UPI00272F3D1A|nr:tetratricopeptide repeat protein [Daejeonella sp.]MDP2414988.1 tetratricopeptide repeat protein [Daejeonella sp.]